MTSHDETLILQLLSDVTGARARHLNPSLGEDGAGGKHVGDVDNGVDGVDEGVLHVQWGRHVVDKSRNGRQLAGALLGLPDSEEADEEVLREA